MYSTYSQGKSVAAERFIRNFQNKIYKTYDSCVKIFFLDALNYIVDKYNIHTIALLK